MTAIAGYHYPHFDSSAYLVSSTRGSVTVMSAPTTMSKLAQSRSKADFFKHMGWSDKNEIHKRLYNLMKEEASEARKALSADRSNLNGDARRDPKVVPPFSSSQMTETALYNEVLTIWRNASPETRQVYDLGITYEQGNTDNWIIRWVLWHVFRYRDIRNRNRERPSTQANDSGASSAGSPTFPVQFLDYSSKSPPQTSKGYYDPVKSKWTY